MSGLGRTLIIGVLVVAVVGGAAGIYLYQPQGPGSDDHQTSAPPDEAAPSVPKAAERDEAESRADAEPETEPSDTKEQAETEAPSDETVTVEQCARYLSAACREAVRDDEFGIELLKHHVENNPQARKAMRAIGMQMRPFRFAGRVVDPDGEPIADAEVVYQIGFPFSLGYTEAATTTTDEQGRFRIEARGYSLLIRTIRHPGLTPAPNFEENRHFGPDPRKGHISWEAATPGSPKELVLMRGPSSE